MSDYVKKPVVIEAFRYGIDARPDWFDSKVTANEIITHCGIDRKETQDYYCEIKTLEGVMTGRLGDYIIKGVNGECYPCKPDIFEKTYSAYQPKRKPLPDGKLPLTEEEKKEFVKLLSWHYLYELESVAIVDNLLTIGRSNNGIHCDYIFSPSVKAILWLAERFNLEG